MSPAIAEPSPWEVALGDRFTFLHPRLAPYFSRIPDGSVGRGQGTFDRVGTPRMWAWPVLAILARAGVVFPVWGRDVPFTVINRPRGRWVDAVRIFHFPAGDRVMVDSITASGGVVVDALGFGGVVRAALQPSVVDGALELRSRATGLRVGPFRLRVPGVTVLLTERFDEASGRQRVSLELRLPVLGRIYEYAGSFTYGVAPE